MAAHSSVLLYASPEAPDFYRRALEELKAASVPFLVGGAYAFQYFTGIVRRTKDLDVFVRQCDRDWALDVLAGAGYRTEVTYPHWLGKAFEGDDYVDVISNSGNGLAPVDDDWFAHAIDGGLYGIHVRLKPAEEMIWSKAFTMERERFDGADVAHLLHACGPALDWPRLLRRFQRHWHILLSHLVMFFFAYPGESGRIPGWVVDDLIGRLRAELRREPPSVRVCQGTVLSGVQYLIDVEAWGYHDARLAPWGQMTADQLQQWRAVVEANHAISPVEAVAVPAFGPGPVHLRP